MEGNTMIYGYARVSTAAQCRDGNSLQDQITALEKYGGAYSVTVVYGKAFDFKYFCLHCNTSFTDFITACPEFILISTGVKGYRHENHQPVQEAFDNQGDTFLVDYVRVFDKV